MASFNKALLMGNLTREPERRITPAGRPVVSAGIAVDRTWRDRDGQERKEVLYLDFDVWGTQGENFARFFHQGDPVLLEGRLRTDRWKDAEGRDQTRIRLTVLRWTFCGGVGPRRPEEPSPGRGEHAFDPGPPGSRSSARPGSGRSADRGSRPAGSPNGPSRDGRRRHPDEPEPASLDRDPF